MTSPLGHSGPRLPDANTAPRISITVIGPVGGCVDDQNATPPRARDSKSDGTALAARNGVRPRITSGNRRAKVRNRTCANNERDTCEMCISDYDQ